MTPQHRGPLRYLVRATLSLGALVLATAATAQTSSDGEDEWERPYLAIQGGYSWLDEDLRGAEHGTGLQILFGWRLSERWSMELQTNYFNLDTGRGAATDFYRSSLGLDAVYAFSPRGWSPLLILGVGGAYNDVLPNSDDSTDFTANAGLGLMTPALNDYGLRLRLEGRYTMDFRDQGDPEDIHAYLGLVLPLRKPRRIEVVRTEVREVIKERIVPQAPPRDSDGDGVPDDQDRCPDTIRGTQVDANGCAIQHSVITLQGVHFENDSARLSQSSLTMLEQAAAALRGQPSMQVEVAGHTDSAGSDAYNQRLSERRAASVVDHLVQSGIDRSRLKSVGYGESRPIADNASAEGRASNRRVEFRVLTR